MSLFLLICCRSNDALPPLLLRISHHACRQRDADDSRDVQVGQAVLAHVLAHVLVSVLAYVLVPVLAHVLVSVLAYVLAQFSYLFSYLFSYVGPYCRQLREMCDHECTLVEINDNDSMIY